jgi:hypothetical protein
MPPSKLLQAVQSGDRRASLEALRDRLAMSITRGDDVKSVAPLANQLRAVLAELDELPVQKEASLVDDLASRRTDRLAAAKGGDLPAGGDVVGR